MRKYLSGFIFLIAFQANAQFQLSGEIRPRLEYRDGYKSFVDSTDNPALFVGQRTRLNAFYTKDNLRTGISIQDVRVWGSQSQQNLSDGLLSVNEAWFEYDLTKKLSIKAGRQQLVYNDHRIFGNSDWNHQGRSHDLLLFKCSDSTWTLHAGFAFNQNKEQLNTTNYTVTNSYKALQFFWLNKKIKKVNASFLFVNNGIQSPLSSTAIRFNQVTGTHLEYTTDKVWLMAKGYYQSGKDGGTNKDLNAFLAGVEFMYKLKSGVSLAIGYEYLSGQSQTDTTKAYRDEVHNFTPLYGTGHKFSGYMDYFYAGSSHGSVGLQDLYLRLKYQKEKFFILFEPHYFISAADVLDISELTMNGNYRSMESTLGTELDLSIGYIPSKTINFKLGYSQMFGTSTLETIKGGDSGETNNWAYFMITVKPDFIK
jgi:hypothetical protein